MLTPGIANIWLYPPADWVLCWAKPGSPRRSNLGGFNEWEPVLMYGKRRIYNDLKWLAAWNNTSSHTGDHPCPKPENLMRWLVEQGSDPTDTILDPFAGSGTTLVAAKALGRKAIGIEIEERYCEIAVRRLQQSVMAFA
jgi:site-specific DNA-methyltransferase (adenine-specific)